MLISLNWLREFIPFSGDAAELGGKLTMAGLEVEDISRPYAALRPIVTGLVVTCAKHPQADKLSVCRVDVGDEVLDIVCGAPNVAAGQKVAVVRAGSTLPTGLAVKKAKLRGAPSNGMICSEFELGLSDEHEGILVLPDSAVAGSSVFDALGLDDEILDISITPNRGDCLSVLGIAREAAALLRLPLRLPDFERHTHGADARAELSLETDHGLAPLYHGLVIENVKNAPSPGRLRYRLNAVGMRPISNVVDATNYVMLELGQPLHAFDLDRITDRTIRVRAADPGETLVTLDGKKRLLEASDITIRDGRGAVGLGGMMGGLNSEILPETRRVFLESAVFNPFNIRKTARRLNLHSEATFRFERGVDQGGATYALERAAHLLAGLSGGHVRPGLIKDHGRPRRKKRITLRRGFAQARIGTSVGMDDSFYEETLKSLGCEVEDISGGLREGEKNPAECWIVTPPSWRYDLTREVDLVEEVVRLYGVDRIPAALPGIARNLESAGLPETKTAFISRVKHWARGASLNEIITYSFTGSKDLEFLGLDASDAISLQNPLSDDLNVLRPHLAPGLLGALRNNLAQGAPFARLFETAAAFAADPSSETGASEQTRLGLILHGERRFRPWPDAAGDLDYSDIKGLIEHLMHFLSLPEADFVRAESLPWLSPAVDILLGAEKIGYVGRVKREIADRYLARKEVWSAEIDLDLLQTLHKKSGILFKSLPIFPPARRDITFIAPPGLRADSIRKTIEEIKGPMEIEARLIDCFEPQGKDERNLTFRLTFRRADRTLKDAEADKQRELIAEAVQKTLSVRM
ncbi:MAG: phenylalanine--tRNA ligase subunit beta [Desulfovibrio sp.]|jgi:phenylalanyl-tRNA synthetase beta chain|nr:phenylalanine--tRNA ligase subunit beta [Desulfovibrio sp.]